MANKSGWRHNIMSLDSLVTNLNESFGLGIVKSDLTNPTVEKMMDIYYPILNDLNLIKGCQTPIATFLLDECAREEDLEQAITYSNIYSIMRGITGVGDDITFGDLINPTTRRVQQILSNFYNFWAYCCSREEERNAVINKCMKIAEIKDRVRNETPNLEKQINDAISDIFNKKLQCDAKAQEAADKTERCKEYMEIKFQLQNEIKKLKAEQNETNLKYTQSQNTQNELELKIKDCEDRIVESPDILDAKLSELNSELNQIKMEQNQLLKKTENREKAIKNCSMWIVEISAIKSLIKSISDQRNDRIEIEEEKKKIDINRQVLLEQILDSDANLKIGCDQVNLIKEKIHSVEHKQNLETSSLISSIETAKQSLEKIKLDKIARNKDLKERLDEIELLSDKIGNLRVKWQLVEETSDYQINAMKIALQKYYDEAESRLTSWEKRFS